jgi:UDP-N-acetylglucosamine acyltransferase
MIHPLAIIHPDAKIGANVEIGPFTSIEGNVIIEDRTWIGPNVTIFSGARIGKNCKIFPGAVISAVPQDLKFEGEETTVTIGDNTVVRECVTISRGTKDRFDTKIGSNCLLMAYVHVAHDCIIGNNVILVNAVQSAGHVVIDDFAIIGGASAIHQFVKIGAHAMISGGSLVRKDVPPYIKAGREPLSYAGVNSLGLRRRGFSNEKIHEIQEVYRYLFLKDLNNSKAIETIERELPASDERDYILKFFKESDRGIMKGYTR